MNAQKITLRLEILVGPAISRAEYNQAILSLKKIQGVTNVSVKQNSCEGYIFILYIDLNKFDKPSMQKIHTIFSEEPEDDKSFQSTIED